MEFVYSILLRITAVSLVYEEQACLDVESIVSIVYCFKFAVYCFKFACSYPHCLEHVF
jgi:hypothetical protein